jgi:threonine dehydrogenase-like Zn-dependent dehydrogenase
MRVATWEAIRTVEVGTAAEPSPGDEDIVLDVGACGICGSDVHSFLEGAWIAPGMGMGHEYSGTISAVGRSVVGLSVGDRITLNPAHYCGECDRCRDGHENLCSRMSGAGAGFADQVLIPHAVAGENVFILPDDVDFASAAFLEPLSVAMRAVRELRPPLDEPILITGLGSIGQCVIQILAAQGATQIVAVDTSAPRRDAAVRSGAALALDPRDGDVVELLLERFGTTSSPFRPRSGAFGSAFECSGAAVVFDQVFQLVRAAGSVSLIALTAEPIRVDPNAIVQKELRVLGSFAYSTEDVRAAFDLLATHAVAPSHLISHTFDLEDIQAAFEAQSDSATSIKVMVRP